MTSTIDATKPLDKSLITSSVLRALAAAAKFDIEALQTAISELPDPLTRVLTGFTASTGTITAADTILTAFNKLVGNLEEWRVPVGGTAGQMLVKINGADNNVTWETVASGGGKIINITQLVVTIPSSQSLTANVVSDITNMTITLTPTSPTSRFLVEVNWFGESSLPYNMMLGLRRNGVAIGAAAQVGLRNFGFVVSTVSLSGENSTTPEVASFSYLDSPATASDVTYTVTARCNAANTLYNNRTISDTDSTSVKRGTSTITVTELSS